MAKKEPSTSVINADGLRYSSKVKGAVFEGSGTTMSCFLCGKHKPRDTLRGKRLFGSTVMVCKDACTKSGP